MDWFLSELVTAIIAFASTNIDDLLLLSSLCGSASIRSAVRCRVWHDDGDLVFICVSADQPPSLARSIEAGSWNYCSLGPDCTWNEGAFAGVAPFQIKRKLLLNRFATCTSDTFQRTQANGEFRNTHTVFRSGAQPFRPDRNRPSP
jgi:hypothetical protein